MEASSTSEMDEEKRHALTKIIEGFWSTSEKLKGYTMLNLYVFGSHLHRCAGPKSDNDFVCVASGAFFPGIRRVSNENEEPEKENVRWILSSMSWSTLPLQRLVVDLNVYHIDYFRELMQQNVVMILLCVFAPPEATWRETVNLKAEYNVGLFNSPPPPTPKITLESL